MTPGMYRGEKELGVRMRFGGRKGQEVPGKRRWTMAVDEETSKSRKRKKEEEETKFGWNSELELEGLLCWRSGRL